MSRNSQSLIGWHKDEKYILLQALKLYGSQDLNKIQKKLPHKSVAEVQAAIIFYKDKAFNSTIFEKKKRLLNRTRIQMNTPLNSWAKKLTDNFSFNELQTETAAALKILAECEDFPPPSTIDAINFKELYQQIANALEGKSIILNHLHAAIFYRLLLESSLVNKTLLKHISLNKVVKLANTSEKEITFPISLNNQEANNIRHIALQKKYNPFAFSDDMLKFEAKLLVKCEKEKKPK